MTARRAEAPEEMGERNFRHINFYLSLALLYTIYNDPTLLHERST